MTNTGKQIEGLAEKSAASPETAAVFIIIGLALYFFIRKKGYRINPALFFIMYMLPTSIFYFDVGFHLFYYRIILIAYAFYFLVTKIYSFRWNSTTISILLFLWLCLAGLPIVLNYAEFFRWWFSILASILFFLILIDYTSTIGKLEGIIFTGIMCGFLWSIVGLSLFLLRNESITSGFSYKLQRVVALANDANYFAAALLIWIQFAFFWFIRKNAKNKFTILLSLITMSMAVIFSYSRGAWLGLAFMFFLDFVMFLIYLQKLSSMADLKKVAFSIFIISVLAGGVFATFVSLQERMESVSTEKNLGAGRVSVWNDAIIIVKDNPITGVGLNNYKLYTLHNRSGLKAPGSAVHNVFLNILVETGIFGFLIYIFFLGTIFVKFRIVRYIQNESIAFWFIASFGAIVTQLICSLFISNVYEEPFYIIIALFLALYNLHIYSSQEIAC